MRYARGRYAWGICAKSGIRLLRRKMVVDGQTGMLVHPGWYDPKHPLEIPPVIDDPVAIEHPAPDPDPSVVIPDDYPVWTGPPGDSDLTTPGGLGSIAVDGVHGLFDEGWDPIILDQAVTAGMDLSFVRFNFLRPHSEGHAGGVYNGQYDFSKYDAALTKMHELDIKHIMCLFYGADPWDGDFEGFARWAAAAALYEHSHYPNTLAALQIWNEPDGSWPVSAPDYCIMAAAIKAAIRVHTELDDIPIAGGVTFGIDLPYWTALIAGGVLDSLDIVDFHNYDRPEQLLIDLPLLQAAMGTVHRPFYVSEWGANSSLLENQIARRLTINKVVGLLGASYFPLRDYPSFPTPGLLTVDGAAKAQSADFVEWQGKIGRNATYVGRDPINRIAYSYHFTKPDLSEVRHLWATAPTRVLINGVVTHLLTTAIYVTGPATVVIDPTEDVLLADVDSDFTVAAQDSPWTYLYRQNDDTGEANMTATVDHWFGPDAFCNIGPGPHQHPGASLKSVRRWTAPSNMRIKISGYCGRFDPAGDGTNVRILHNTTVIWKRFPLFPATYRYFTLIRDVLGGDVIDLECSSNGNIFFDAAYWGSTLIYQTQHAVGVFFIPEDFNYQQGNPFKFLSRDADNSHEEDMSLVNGEWVRADDHSCRVQSDGHQKPGATKKSVQRWEGPIRCNVRVQGSVEVISAGGPGVNVRIRHGGTALFSRVPLQHSDGPQVIDFTTVFDPDDHLDFELSAVGGDNSFADVRWNSITITQSTFVPQIGLTPTMGFQIQADQGQSEGMMDIAVNEGMLPNLYRFGRGRNQTESPFGPPWGGGYNFTSYGPYLQKCQDQGVPAMITSQYGGFNVWDGDFTGYAAYVVATLDYCETNYPGVVKYIEVWNEPDGGSAGSFIGPADMTTMTQNIWDAVRADSRFDDIKICSPVLTTINRYGYWQDAIDAGLSNYCDMISAHFYARDSEELLWFWPSFQAIITPKEVNLSEWGAIGNAIRHNLPRWLTVIRVVADITVANYYLLADAAGFVDAGPLDGSGNPHPLKIALWNQWYDEIGPDAPYLGRDVLDGGVYSYQFHRFDDTHRIIWAHPDERNIIIDGELTHITRHPIYVHGSPTIELAPDEVMLAGISADYTISAQDTPWHYLTRDLDNSNETDMTLVDGYWKGADPDNYCAPYMTGVSATKKTVRRFTVPSDMRIRITGACFMPTFAHDGTLISILHNGAAKFTRFLGSNNFSETFNVIFEALSGDIIEFENDPIAVGGDDMGWYDTLVYSTDHPLSYTMGGRDYSSTWQGHPWEYMWRSDNNLSEGDMVLEPYSLGFWVTPFDFGCLHGGFGNPTYSAPVLGTKAVRRWTPPVDLNVHVTGSVFRFESGGNGTDVRIVKANPSTGTYTTLFEHLALTREDGTIDFEVDALIEVGESLDFELGSGGGSNAFFDACNWSDVEITWTDAEPQTIVSWVSLKVPLP